ncbi:N-acetylmuramoyl-L-alanine amidase [Thermodesulforhabdus norvegica]|uniref:N-acetylmuramoyl-L-alanine amidase n=1 Tax=Thermodesulforhabdus norvegica TaxID=39841 RepID=A0A1I4U4A2_9BACT|nr:N-acetylmuramoyl-L-alanine amidase [Thermodesulforhabdus norvegica]SFM83832.1 N-acetylmuramoyl-L-alanine amidase [Thermodesulforhabdus norvegica]
MIRIYHHRIFWIVALIATFSYNCTATTVAYGQEEPGYYEKGRDCYRRVLSLGKKATPDMFKSCVEHFDRALQSTKAPPDKCHYYLGQIYHRCFDMSGKQSDFLKALFHYRTITQHLSRSNLADDAQFLIGILYSSVDIEQAYKELKKVEELFPNGDMRNKAAQKAKELEKQIAFLHPEVKKESTTTDTGLIYLEEVYHWSGTDYTRVVLHTSSPVRYEVDTLPADPKAQKPPRLFLDLFSCHVGENLENRITVTDGFLRQIRVGQFNSSTARVVLDLESIRDYRVFTLENPFRIVVDILGKEPKKVVSPPPVLDSLPEQLHLDIRTIVIDPGHGGKDKGAIGPTGLYEKDVTLAIAKELKRILEQRGGYEVYLTRTTDKFLSLEQRTAIANAKKADLFISIHTNAHEDPRLGGVETYFLNFSADKEAARVAALENAIAEHKLSDLEAILRDLLFITKLQESSQLAQSVHQHLVKELRKRKTHLRDLGVKQAPFYVLMGANMPAILVEVAFISNPKEEKLLKNKIYVKYIAEGLASGITDYAQTVAGIARVREGR